MAIRRCPYCKAIIDESQKYCNNCGTQLLFPEDEEVEEDVKGERLVDDDFKDADEESDDSAKAADEEADKPEEIDLGAVLEKGTGFPDEVDPGEEPPVRPVTSVIAEEPEIVPEEAPAPRKGRIRKVSLPSPSAPVKAPPRRPTSNLPPHPSEVAAPLKPPTAPIQPPPEALPPTPPPLPPVTPVPKDSRGFMFSPPSKDEEPDLEIDQDPDLPPDPDVEAEDDEEAEEVEKRNTEVDTKEEIARLIEALEKKQKNAGRQDIGGKILAPLEKSRDALTWRNISEDTSSAEPVEEAAGERTDASSFVPGDTMDFQDEVMRRAAAAAPPKATIGMPEPPVKKDDASLFDSEEEDRPEILVPPSPPTPAAFRKPTPTTPAPLAGGAPPARGKEALSPGIASPDTAAAVGEDIGTPRAGLGFLRRCAAAVFDLVFVAVLWLAAVGLAALLMNTAAPGLVRTSMLPLGLLFAVLFAGYLFLFFFFLGETLGGRLMARRG